MEDSIFYFLIGFLVSLAVGLATLKTKSSTKGTMTGYDMWCYQQSMLEHPELYGGCMPTNFGEILYGADVPLRRVQQVKYPPNGGCQDNK